MLKLNFARTAPVVFQPGEVRVFAASTTSPYFMAQKVDEVTLRFLSFPKNANPQPVELLIGKGEALEVKTPTNALSQPYKVKRLSTWAVGKMKPAETEEENSSFTTFGSAPARASSDQLILLIRDGKENKDGMRVIPDPCALIEKQ